MEWVQEKSKIIIGDPPQEDFATESFQYYYKRRNEEEREFFFLFFQLLQYQLLVQFLLLLQLLLRALSILLFRKSAMSEFVTLRYDREWVGENVGQRVIPFRPPLFFCFFVSDAEPPLLLLVLQSSLFCLSMVFPSSASAFFIFRSVLLPFHSVGPLLLVSAGE